MFIKSLKDTEPIEAADESLLRVIFNPILDSLETNYSLAHARVKAGQITLAHQLSTSEVYHIIGGCGKMYIDDESRNVLVGDTIYIPANAVQKIENTGADDLIFICIVDPAWDPKNETILK